MKGSRQIVEGLQALVKEHGLEDKVEMSGRFCMGDCQNGVCLTVDDQKFSLKPEDVQTTFSKGSSSQSLMARMRRLPRWAGLPGP